MEVKVRELLKEDIPDVLEIIGSNYESHVASAQRELQQMFSSVPPSIHNQFLVVIHNNTVIGCGGFYIDKDDDVEGIYWAHWFYVRSDYHNQKIGSRILSEVENRVASLGGRKLYLDVGNESDQPAATAFYLKRNFVKEGELLDYFKDGENKQIFAKRLR